jgi:hypothetical protein
MVEFGCNIVREGKQKRDKHFPVGWKEGVKIIRDGKDMIFLEPYLGKIEMIIYGISRKGWCEGTQEDREKIN